MEKFVIHIFEKIKFCTLQNAKFLKDGRKIKLISSSKIFQIVFYRLDKKHHNFCIHDENIITCFCNLHSFS